MKLFELGVALLMMSLAIGQWLIIGLLKHMHAHQVWLEDHLEGKNLFKGEQ